MSNRQSIQAYGRSDRGYLRPENEDDFLICSDQGLYFVADGLGGHPGGAVASSLVIQWTAEWLSSLDASCSRDNLLVVLEQVNRRLMDYGTANPELTGLGTTLTGIYRERNRIVWLIHAGDSRAYGLDVSGQCTQLTGDQTLAMEAVCRGSLTPEAALTHPSWHLLTSCFGSPDLSPQVESIPDAYAAFFLCTDGLSNAVSFPEIQGAMERNQSRPEILVNDLVELALERGGSDNITAIGISMDYGI